MFHGRDGAHICVLGLGCLSWNGLSSRLNVSNEGDGAFQAGMVASGIWWWDRGCQTPAKRKTFVSFKFYFGTRFPKRRTALHYENTLSNYLTIKLNNEQTLNR